MQTQAHRALEFDELFVRHIDRIADCIHGAVDRLHAACRHGGTRDLAILHRLGAEFEVLVCILCHEFDLSGELSLQWFHESEPARLANIEVLVAKGDRRFEGNSELLEALAVRRDIILLALAREFDHPQLKGQVLPIFSRGIVRQAHRIADRMRRRGHCQDLVTALALRGARRRLAGLLLNAELYLKPGLGEELKVRRNLATQALHVALPACLSALKSTIREGNRRRKHNWRRLAVDAECLRAGKARIIGRSQIYLDRLVDLLGEIGGQVDPVANAREARAQGYCGDTIDGIAATFNFSTILLRIAGRDRTLSLPQRVVGIGGEGSREGDHDIARTGAARRKLSIGQLQGGVRAPQNFDRRARNANTIVARQAWIVLRHETEGEALVEGLVNVIRQLDAIARAMDEPRAIFLFFLTPFCDRGLIRIDSLGTTRSRRTRCFLNAGLDSKAGGRDHHPRLGRDITDQRFKNLLSASRAGREFDVVKSRGWSEEDWRGFTAGRNRNFIVKRLVIVGNDSEGDIFCPIDMHVFRQDNLVAHSCGIPRHIEHHLTVGCRPEAGRLVARFCHVARAQIERALRDDHLETGGDLTLDRHEDLLLLDQSLLKDLVAEAEVRVEPHRNRRTSGAQRKAHNAIAALGRGQVESDRHVLLDVNVRRHARTQPDRVRAIRHAPFLRRVERAIPALRVAVRGGLIAQACIDDATRHLQHEIGVVSAFKRHELRLLPSLRRFGVIHVDKGHRGRVGLEDDGRRRARHADRISLHEGGVLGVAHLKGDNFVDRLELAFAEVRRKADLLRALGNVDLDFGAILVRLPTGSRSIGLFLGALRADTAIGLPFGKNQHLGAVEIPGHLHKLGLPVDGAHRIFDILKDDRWLEDHDELGTRDRKIEGLEVIRIVNGMHLEGGATLKGDQNVIGKLHTEADRIGTCWHGELNLAVARVRRAGIATPGASLEACLQARIGLRDLHQQVGGIGLVQFDHRMGPACRVGLELDIGKGKFMKSRCLAGHAGDHDLPDLLDLGLERRGQRDRHRPRHRLAHVARQEELVAERYPVRPNCGCAGRRLDQAAAHFRTRVSARANTERTVICRGFGGCITTLFPIDGARPVFTSLIKCRIGTRIDDEDQLFFTELTLQRLDDALLAHGAGREFDALEHHLRIEQVGLRLAEDRDIPGLVQSRVVD